MWLLRLVWATLPATSGPAAARALDGWSTAPRTVAAALLWATWAGGLLALLAPRPPGLTALRVAAPTFFVLAAIAAIAGDAAAPVAVGALVATAATLAFVTLPDVAVAAANGVAYGDERRFPLRTPPPLLLGPLPLAPLLVAGGVATGPLLLADGRLVAGIATVVVGLPVAAFLGRALHGLSRRWAVLVPAGFVLADPLTLPDPVLFLRERIAGLRAVDPRAPAPAGALDLRLGALVDSVVLTLDRETELLYIRRGRRGSVSSNSTEVLFAVTRRAELLTTAARRRIRVT